MREQTIMRGIKRKIADNVTTIKNNKDNYYDSNIYNYPDDVLELKECDGATAYIVEDRGLFRVYFAANDPSALHELLNSFPVNSGLEIITQEVNSKTEKALSSSGYLNEFIYLRGVNPNLQTKLYTNIPPKYKNICPSDYVQKARPTDTEEIYEYIHEVFDGFADHLQTEDEVLDDINNGLYVIHRDDKKLMTLTKHVCQGKKVHMEYAANRGESIWMHALYLYCLEDAVNRGINMAYNWVRNDNNRALNFYKRYGIIPGTIKNYVYRKR